jgi:flagellar protein FlaG
MDIKPIGTPTHAGQTTASHEPLQTSALLSAAPVQTASAVQQPAAIPNLDQVSQAVKDINKSLQAASQGLEFSVDGDTQRIVVKVIDQTTREVLRQMPSEEALQIAKSLDRSQGLLIKQQA